MQPLGVKSGVLAPPTAPCQKVRQGPPLFAWHQCHSAPEHHPSSVSPNQCPTPPAPAPPPASFCVCHVHITAPGGRAQATSHWLCHRPASQWPSLNHAASLESRPSAAPSQLSTLGGLRQVPAEPHPVTGQPPAGPPGPACPAAPNALSSHGPLRYSLNEHDGTSRLGLLSLPVYLFFPLCI